MSRALDYSNANNFQFKTRNITWLTPSGYNNFYALINGKIYETHGEGGNGCATHGRGALNNDVARGLMESGFAQIPIPNANPVIKVIPPHYHGAAALCSDGSLYTWGNNTNGQIGNGTQTYQGTPYLVDTNVVDVYGDGTVNSYDIAGSKLVYKKTDGYLYVCGYNAQGNLGLGDTTIRTSPVQVTSLGNSILNVWSLGGSGGALFVQKTDGTIWATGYNAYGMLGTGNTTNPNVFTDVTTAWGGTTPGDIIWMGGGFGYYDTAGHGNSNVVMLRKTAGNVTSVYTCGDNTWGQCGDTTTTQRTTPYLIPNSSNVKQMSCTGGGPVTLAMLNVDGSLYTWGYNGYGQIGNGNTTNQLAPLSVETGVDIILNDKCFANAYPHNANFFIRKTDNTYWSSGKNDEGQRATGISGTTALTFANSQMKFPTDVIVEEIGMFDAANGYKTYVARTTDNRLFVWGMNGWGSITTATSQHAWVPIEIPVPVL